MSTIDIIQLGLGGGNHMTRRIKLEVYDTKLVYIIYICYDSRDLNVIVLKMQLLIQVECWMICLGKVRDCSAQSVNANRGFYRTKSLTPLPRRNSPRI